MLSLIAAVILVTATVTTAAPRSSAQAAQPAIALSAAVSPATGHIFAISATENGPHWLSMIDARTGKVVRSFAVEKTVGSVVVDDRSGHAFLLSSAPIQVTMLNTRTGAILSRAAYGAGNWVTPSVASRTGQLIAFADQRMIILDTRTGRHLRTLRLQDGLSSGMNDGLSRFVTADAAGQVSIYDMHTWKIVKTLRLPVTVPGYAYSAVQPSNGVILIGGYAFDELYMIDVARGTLRWSLQVPNAAGIHNLLLDERNKRLFAVGAGNYNIHGTIGEPSNGAVTTIDLATHKILRRVAVGVIAMWGVVDATTNRVLVTSESKLDKNGQMSRKYSLVTMLHARTGVLLRVTRIPMTDVMEGALQFDGPRHRAYLYGSFIGNKLLVLDTRTGNRLPDITLAPRPTK
jgi:outer membrane protein assembly factor BamB